MEAVNENWDVIIALIAAIIAFVKLQTETSALRNDVDELKKATEKQADQINSNFVSSVRTESSTTQNEIRITENVKKIESLFSLYNILRDRTDVRKQK
tara:strand:+ start:1740 stop:2033 length:294 start_codon:yes stop_codon:yes gene_type:complete